MDKFLTDRYRWVILLTTDTAEKFEETDFKVIQKSQNLFNPAYTALEIEALEVDPSYNADDVLCMTDAIAVHEEWTNAVVVSKDDLDIIADDIYAWQKSGGCFLGDMLTSLERLHFLMLFFYEQTKEVVTVKDITIRKTKDGLDLPLADNVDELFKEDVYSATFKETTTVLWWQSIIEERGLFLVVLDDELEDEDEDKHTPSQGKYQRYWDDYYRETFGYDYSYGYDDYDYDDRYYQRT